MPPWLWVFLLDVVINVLWVYRAVVRAGSLWIALYCDVLRKREQPVPLPAPARRASRRRRDETPEISESLEAPILEFRVEAESEYQKRVVAWFYRWHETPSVQDWQLYLAKVGMPRVPVHALHVMGRPLIWVNIDLNDGGGSRTLKSGGEPIYDSPIPVGGLAPLDIIRAVLDVPLLKGE
jgi:hypothetical protein